MALPTYCGNNINDIKLLSGTHVLGTNYQCLQKGIGVGMHLPYDDTFSGPYAPVDPRRFYCGNLAVPPAGYFAHGSPSKCLQIGVGIGKSQKAGLGPPRFMYFIRYILPFILIIILSIITFMIMYFAKPDYVTKIVNNTKVIDWDKFTPNFLLYTLVISVVIWILWHKFVLRWI